MKLFQNKYFSLALFVVITSGITAQQIPYLPIDNFTPQGGYQVLSYPFGITAPTNPNVADDINGSNQVTFIAGQRVQLHDGFHAGGFTGNGYFHAQIGGAPEFDVAFMEPNQNTPSVGQFEKLEIGVQLPSTLEQQVNDFLANGTGGLNPFDPEQISLEAQFSRGALSYTVYGFYYDEFIRDPSAMAPLTPANWISLATNYHWRIRFAPPLQGNWTCTISIRLNNSPTYSHQVSNLVFSCFGSSNPGWLKKGNDDWHLAFSGSNQSFFALGQNIAWSGPVFRGSYPISNYSPFHLDGFLDELDFISNLSDNGGNMVRVVNIDNTFELEHHRLGNYSDRMDRGWELDRLIELCEQKNMKISFQCSDTRFGDGTDSFSWADNPYHTQIPLPNKEDFYVNATAMNFFSKKLRYILSRWGYSTSIGIFSLVGEINGHLENYNSNTTLISNQTNWHHTFFDLAKTLVTYRPLLTTTSYVSSVRGSDYRNAADGTPFFLTNCDITTMHSYHAERGANRRRLDEFNQGIFDLGVHRAWPDKPIYFQEMGVATDINGLDIEPNDFEGCSDINYHNSLWATSFMGGFGTGFVWWQWHRNDYRHDNYPALSAFFDDVDFQNIKFKDPDFWDDAILEHNSQIETFYIRDEHADRVMGWVHNSTYWWGNTDLNCPDRNNVFANINRIDDNDDPSTPVTLPLSTKFEIHGLNILQDYTLEWYQTRLTGGLFQTETWQANIFGTMKPIYQGSEPIYYAQDWAYKAYRAGNNFRSNNVISIDTLFCWQDTVEVTGNHALDTLKQFHYFWNFGNGQQSNERNTLVHYIQPGTYLVTLIVTDSLGWADTLKQYIVKPSPCASPRMAAQLENSLISSWNAFPNPVNTNLTLVFDASWSKNILVELYALDGRCIIRQSISSTGKEEIPLAAFPSGVYLLRVTDNEHLDFKKLCIQH